MAWITQEVLAAIRQLPCPQGCVKLQAIVKETGLKSRQVADACDKLVEHGYIVRQHYSDGPAKPGCYTLTDLGKAAEEQTRVVSGPRGPTGIPKIRPDCMRDKAWRVLRIRKKVSVPEVVGLLLDAGCEAIAVTRATNNLQKYFRHLARAGYLQELKRGARTSPTSNGEKRYLLVRDSGVLPPVPLTARRAVFDQNNQETYEFATNQA